MTPRELLTEVLTGLLTLSVGLLWLTVFYLYTVTP